MTTLPVTGNGKVDRAALPDPQFTGSGGRGPSSPVEETLCDLFAQVLGVSEVGVQDSFFTLGGDSIMSMLLVARARRAGLVLSARQVFEHRTVAALARVAAQVRGTDTGESLTDRIGPARLTPVMRELAERAGTSALTTGRFTQAMAVTVPADLDLASLITAVRVVVDHHDMLRARLVVPDEADPAGWRLDIAAPGTAPVDAWTRRVDATGTADLGALLGREADLAAGRIDPRAGVLAQVVWCDAGPGVPGRLLMVVHHLAVDGVSWRVLLPDLAEAYATGAGLAPVPTSYRGWADRLEREAASPERLAELPTWRRILTGPAPLFGNRPLDPRRDVAATLRRVLVPVPAEVTADVLTRVPATFHADVDDVLLAALAAAVARWSRRRGAAHTGGILIDVEGHGRQPLAGGVDLSRTVGWFTSSHPVRLDPGPVDTAGVLAGGLAAGELMRRVKEQLRAVPGDGLGYGLLRHLNPRTAAELGALPTPDIGFNYLGRFAAGVSGTPDAAAWAPAPEGTLGGTIDPGMPLRHTLEAGAIVLDRDGGPELALTLAWPEESLTEEAVLDLATGWSAMLAGLVAHTGRPDAGGHTPSDFPLADISQDEVDEFEEFADNITRQGRPYRGA